MSIAEMRQAIPVMTEEQMRELLEMMFDYLASASITSEPTYEEKMETIRALRGIIRNPDLTHEKIREERLAKYCEDLD